MALSISASVGRFTFASSAAALMIWPDWQYPHCGTSFAIQASCSTLPSLVWPIPSMVVILLPAAELRDVEQDRAGWPFTCTVQAPHSAMPQPYLVPVIPRWSRRTHRRGVSGSASTDMGLPLTFRVIIEELLGKQTFRRADATRSRASPRLVVRRGRHGGVGGQCRRSGRSRRDHRYHGR